MIYDVTFGPATDGDMHFVRDSWAKSLRSRYPWRHATPDAMHRWIVRVCDASEITVARDSEDPDMIVGYVVHERGRGRVHWCYVRHALRGFGIARALVSRVASDGNAVVVTTLPVPTGGLTVESMMRRLGLVYEPYGG